jgi:hypothetical protein
MSSDCQLFRNTVDSLVAIVRKETPDKWLEIAFTSKSSPPTIVILLSPKLGETSFYSQVSEILVPRSIHTAPWDLGLRSGDAQRESGTAD